MPTRRGNVGRRTSEASGFPAGPGGVMPRHDTKARPKAQGSGKRSREVASSLLLLSYLSQYSVFSVSSESF